MSNLALQLFDEDQTHDLLWAERIDGDLLRLLESGLVGHSFFIYPLPVALIEREIVENNIPWADNWSAPVFEFLKELSRTHIWSDGDLNGSYYLFESPYVKDLPSSINFPFPPEIEIEIPPQTTQYISWLESANEVIAGRYCAQLPWQQISVWQRRSKKLVNRGYSPQTVVLSTQGWLFNSVVTDAQLSLSAEAERCLLYSQLGASLDNLRQQLTLTPCQVLTGFTFKAVIYANPGFGIGPNVGYLWEMQNMIGTETQPLSYEVSMGYITDNSVYQAVPDFYGFACLLQKGEERKGAELNYYGYLNEQGKRKKNIEKMC
jgi:hypothetical protein